MGSPEIWTRSEEIVRDVSETRGVVAVETAWKGAGAADPFVIALAQEHGLTVVTSENQGSDDHPKIPRVCSWLTVPCVNGVELFRAEGWTF